MKGSLILLLSTVFFAGCTTMLRTEAPAPIERVRPTPPAPKPKPKPTVQTFPYPPPVGVPETPSPEETTPEAPVPQTPAESFASLPSESATPTDGIQGSPSDAPAEAPTPEPAPRPIAYTAPPPPMPELTPAVRALVVQAERQRQMKDYVGAAATLERAIRITPHEAYLYNRLARVRLEQGRYDQAGNFARRSNSLAKDQPQVQKDNWGMIAVSRQAAGDAEGAAAAREKALDPASG